MTSYVLAIGVWLLVWLLVGWVGALCGHRRHRGCHRCRLCCSAVVGSGHALHAVNVKVRVVFVR